MESPLLYSDLTFEVLSRCSLQQLDKSKLINKACNETTYCPYFIESHKKNTHTVYGYILQSSCRWRKNLFYLVSPDDVDGKKSTVTLDFLLWDSKILASSNQGIICCKTRNDPKEKFYVAKPTTKQVQMLPNPKLAYRTYKVALAVLHSKPMRYKIVRLSLHMNKWYSETFDSKIWKWTKPKEISLPSGISIHDNSVFANGRFHWLVDTNQVLTFDLEQETYTIFALPVPKDDFCNENMKKLVKYKGQLGLIRQKTGSYLEIWVMEDYKNHIWKKIEDVNLDGVKKKEPFCVPHAVALYTSNTALMKGYEFMFYNFDDLSVNVAKLDGLTYSSDDEVFVFRSDHEPVNLRG